MIASTLDLWFGPKLELPEKTDPPPEQGVYPGVERQIKRRYSRPWYLIKNKEDKTDEREETN